jgi:hypothetical protein
VPKTAPDRSKLAVKKALDIRAGFCVIAMMCGWGNLLIYI